jgi:hypothetical protein
LIITLLLMSLLTLIAVALLSLASVTLRSSSQAEAASTARANARLSLMLALGELQNHAGADQRITSTASILDGIPETEALDHVGEAAITGVWDSWIHDPMQSANAPDYEKSPRFRRWLVSGLSEAEAVNPRGRTGGRGKRGCGEKGDGRGVSVRQWAVFR